MNDSGRDVDRRILNAGTTPRFLLLVTLIATSSLGLLGVLLPHLAGKDGNGATAHCLAVVNGAPSDSIEPLARFTARQREAFDSCTEHYATGSGPWGIAGTAALFLVAFLIYWLQPAWKTWRGRLIPVPPGELSSELAHLTARAGLTRQPHYVLDWAAATPSAAVFGRWRRPTVSLHGGLIARRARDPEGFGFVILHELAHIRNRDVDIAYATEALWRVFAALVLLPYTVLVLIPRPWPPSFSGLLDQWRTDGQQLLAELVRVSVLLILILLIRADVLRVRELYADLDAARWSGSDRGLRTLADEPGPNRPGRGLRRLGALWRTHPVWARRAESLLSPGPLFGVSALTLFLTGIAAMTAQGMAVLELGAPEWAVAVLITGITGTALWRATAYAALTGQQAPSGLRAGLWLGIGVASGELLSFRLAGRGWLPAEPHLLLLVVAGCAVLMEWVARCAEAWIVTCRGRSLLVSHLAGLAALLLVFGAWFAWWNSTGFLFQAGNIVAGVSIDEKVDLAFPGAADEYPEFRTAFKAIILLDDPALLVGGVLLWLFPLLVWARRPAEPGDGPPPWKLMAHPHGAWPVATDSLPRLRRALAVAAAGGTLGCGAIMATWMWLLRGEPPTRLEELTTLLALLWVATTYCLFATASVTAFVAGLTGRRFPLPLALVAAGTSLFIGLAGTFAVLATQGCLSGIEIVPRECRVDPATAWSGAYEQIAAPAVGVGPFVALVFASVGTAVGVQVRAFRAQAPRRRCRGGKPRPSAPAPRPRNRLLLRRIYIALAVSTSVLMLSAWQNWFQPSEPTKPPGEIPHGQQVARRWLADGGTLLMDNFRNDADELVSAYADLGRGGEHLDPVAVHDMCESWASHGRKAREFPGPGIPALDTLWTNLTEDAYEGGTMCLHGMEYGKETVLTQAFEKLVSARRSYRDLTARLQEFIAPPTAEREPLTGH
ncbi:M48 family metalloprotease [Streptomyces sp. SudanB182_2057]|uniref:M48 family metalloprotease n=1 Tax=Streptomyces sp. SudanB182_2057 TaxID=3035281 RepID=UPI003F553E5A